MKEINVYEKYVIQMWGEREIWDILDLDEGAGRDGACSSPQ